MIAPAQQILLVEDNPADADLIREALDLDARGEQVVHHSCLRDALEYLSGATVDIVLLDLHLPDGIGVTCVEALQRRAPEIPVVVLTGIDDEQVAVACLEAGAQDYLSKMEMRGQTLRRSIGYALARTRERAERIRAEALRLRLAAIVESSNDAIVSCDPAGMIVSWNRGATHIFGYRGAEAIGRPLRDVIRPAASEEGEGKEAVVRVDVLSTADELSLMRRDGSTVVVSVVGCELRDAHGAVLGFAGIYRDITAHRLRDRELRRRNQELLQRDRQMRALAARLTSVREGERSRISRAVHDELGQLLTGLKMDLKWMERHLSPEESSLAAVSEKLRAAGALVDETMGTVQRIAAELRPTALDAVGLAAAIRDEARRFEERTGVAVQVRVNGAAQPEPDVATALFRVLQELLTNIARHAQATHAIVTLVDDAGHWVLEVEDDGIGLPPEAEARPASLGLLGIRERAAALGGTVSIGRGMERGTIASIRIPPLAIKEA